jgi:FAD/FMN-containing dehydrogenase/Fe-S oxidoreductase
MKSTTRSGDPLALALARELAGEVAFDEGTRALYSTDASNYRAVPRGVVVPRTIEDVVLTVALCREHETPIISRGGGTSTSGQACGPGVVIDWSRYLDAIIEIDAPTRTAIVQPGVVLSSLQQAAALHGLRFGPDPSTRDRCTIGGMLGNNACGAHSLRFGKTDDNLEWLDVLTIDGERFRAGAWPDAAIPDQLSSGLREIIDGHEADLRAAFQPGFSRRVSGYGLGHLLGPDAHLGRALVGSEGTCVTVLQAGLRLVPLAAARVLLVLGFENLYDAADFVPALAAFAPSTIEGVDDRLVELARRSLSRSQAMELLPDAAGYLFVEFEGPSEAAAEARALEVLGEIRAGVKNAELVVSQAAQRAVWRVREEGAGLATRRADGREAYPGWEDPAVPPERLGAYLRAFDRLLVEHGLEAVHYGHYGEGCVHARIDFDFVTVSGRANFRHFIEDAADLVVSLGGSLSGEHGDGQARGELLSRMYGPGVLEAFSQFKALFDPPNLMNPGRLIDARPFDADLRAARVPAMITNKTALALRADEGDLARAARRCVGVGKCRSFEGAMCPSFLVTRDEKHSTRGRARLLAEMLDGETLRDGYQSDAVAESLDLCLSCKACKSECPVSVDMAAYKAEFLAKRYHRRVRPRVHYALGYLPLWALLSRPVRGLLNGVLASHLAGRVARRLGGIGERAIPALSRTSIAHVLADRTVKPADASVLLWRDTFTEHFEPEIASDALSVLNSCGHDVALAPGRVCCGRTWYSTGQLGVARAVLRRSLALLEDGIARGLPVLVLEPSCAAMLRDEARELLPDDPRSAALSALVVSFPELVGRSTRPELARLDRAVLAQLHCHAHAEGGAGALEALVGELHPSAVQVEQRCCGLAGDFGFAAGHEAISRAVFERHAGAACAGLEEDAVVVADGFSCRTQLRELAGREARHSAQVLAAMLEAHPRRRRSSAS